MIQLKNVSKEYKTGTVALKRANLVIEDGEFVFITGHSGAGKSTIIRLLMCEEMPSYGDVIVNGINTKELAPRSIPKYRRSLGVVFQDFRLIPSMNVYDNVAFAMRVVGKTRSEIKKRVGKVLEIVELQGKAKSMPNQLSGGEQQRVALARALVNSPKIIIADEPTGNIDPELSREIMRMLEIINQSGVTVVVVTHDRELVNDMKKREVILEKGRIKSDSVTAVERSVEDAESVRPIDSEPVEESVTEDTVEILDGDTREVPRV